ncbi:DUF6538 domain-containing protein [Methylobacterium sp. CM6241]
MENSFSDATVTHDCDTLSGEPVAHHPNLTTREGTYYLRMRVPVDIARDVGRSHLVRSLRTKDRRVALTRFRIEQARLEREWETVRRQRSEIAQTRQLLASGRLERLAPREIEDLAIRWFEEAVQQVARSPEERDELRFVDWETVLADARAEGQILESPRPDDYLEAVRATTDQILLRAGMPPEPHGPGKLRRSVRRPNIDWNGDPYRRLASVVRRAMLALNARQVAALAGSTGSKGDPLFDGTPRPDAQPKRTLDDLIRAFESDPGRGARTGKTNADYGMVFRALRELVGTDMDISGLSRDHAKQVRDLFRALPPNATKRFPTFSLAQAAETAKREGLAPLNTQTVNSHITKMATLFNWAVREEWLSKNPATGLTIEEAPQAKREPFSLQQMRAIFNAPLYTGCTDDEIGYAKVGPLRPRRARFWVPILSLFHGLRLNECCQLAPDDIAERDGVAVILVRAAEASQRVKSKTGTRIVPLHPEILAMGILDFVADARKASQGRLFPELSADSRGYFSDAFQKWFARFLKSCGAAKASTTFHSFRHGWADRLREAGVPEDRRRALGGWADTGVDAGYGRGFPTKMLADDIASVKFSGLSLEHLKI